MLEEKLQDIQKEAQRAFEAAESCRSLYEIKVKFLGKNGSFSNLMRDIAKVPKEEKPKFGKLINEAKKLLEDKYLEMDKQLRHRELEQQVANEGLDMSLPGPWQPMGALHPVTLVINEVVGILSNIGFSVRNGPHIENDWNNFQALNIPLDHPARDMQDTFYVDETHVLRTHTSPVQIRTMENETPPLRILSPGATFRHDSDMTHSPHFHQVEGLVIDRKVSMADLKGTIGYFFKQLFGKETKTRLRPSFFPFTEPSAEADCSCPLCKGKGCALCKQTGWLEMGGCGLVNPKVLEAVKIKYPEWQGYAFGFGIERMAMVKYRIGHIRLFSDNDVRFLRQFPS